VLERDRVAGTTQQPQVIQQLGSSTLRMEMITAAGAVYVNSPRQRPPALPTSGRQWVKVDLAKLSSIPGLSSLTGNPTTSVLRSLRSVSGGVVDEGSPPRPSPRDERSTSGFRPAPRCTRR
jgi:hypothetical protein